MGSRPPLFSVLVTYRPAAAVLDHLQRLCRQTQNIIVVDNASDGDSVSLIEAIEKLPGVRLIRNPSNLGIAAALNAGIRLALQSGADWIATFDQDTGIPEDFFGQLLEAYQSCPSADGVGMVVPGVWKEPGTVVSQKTTANRSAWSFVRGAVNSGSLIKAEVFDRAGFYDDALFIDYVDTDFCLRLQQQGFKILSADTVVLEHELGEKQTRNLLVGRVSFRIHTAWRYYYIMRNRLVLYRRFLTSFPAWGFHDARWMLLELGRILFLEHGRKAKLHAAFLGIKDGLLGRTGRHAEFPPRA